VLRQRVPTALLIGALVIGLDYLGVWWVGILFAAIAAICTLEIGAMMKVSKSSAETIIALCFSTLIVLLPWFERLWYVLLYVLLLLTIVRRQQFSFPAAAVLFAGALYSSYAFRTLLDLRLLSDGAGWVLIVFVAIWATDTGAYFVGRALGGRKLLPEVSPKKTVSGAVGGLLFATIGTAGAGWVLLDHGTFSFARLALLGLAISIAGQAGDLVESALKRHYDVKDSGWLLPGHGGVLDRFDSLLLAAPIAYHLIIWLFFTR